LSVTISIVQMVTRCVFAPLREILLILPIPPNPRSDNNICVKHKKALPLKGRLLFNKGIYL
jgi:hypothetical protein